MSNSKEKDFVENWKKLLDEFKEVYLTWMYILRAKTLTCKDSL
jgi:hypothetical protein